MEPTKCSHCHRVLLLGDELVSITAGVVVHRGYVATEEARVYCSKACARKHLADNWQLKERTP